MAVGILAILAGVGLVGIAVWLAVEFGVWAYIIFGAGRTCELGLEVIVAGVELVASALAGSD